MATSFHVIPLKSFINIYNCNYPKEEITIIKVTRKREFDGVEWTQINSYVIAKQNHLIIEEQMLAQRAECSRDYYDVSDCNLPVVFQLLSGLALCKLGTNDIYNESINDFDVIQTEFFNLDFLCKANNIINDYLREDDYKSKFYKDSNIKELLASVFKSKILKFKKEEVDYKKR